MGEPATPTPDPASPSPGQFTRQETALDRDVQLIRVPSDLVFAAAVRLVGDQTDDPHSAAHRFLENAGPVGIDLSKMWATVLVRGGVGGNGGGRGEPVIRQVSLAVQNAGRTAMMFVSGPPRRTRLFRGPHDPLGGPAAAAAERAAVVEAACRFVAEESNGGAVLAQSLLESREREALSAFLGAGFTQVGDLAYLRRTAAAPSADAPLPDGTSMISLAELRGSGMGSEAADRLLGELLDRTYIDTLDCPELCGLRSTEDVLASHRAVGRYDPALWWMVLAGDRPVGCALFNIVPEQESVELVYLGLDPGYRGRGLARAVMTRSLRHLLGWPAAAPGQPAERRRVLVGIGGVTCAVDGRNAAALALYKRFGFQRFAVRVPVVKGLRSPSH